MRLNIEQYEYMVGPNPGAGIKLLIHENTEVPLVRDLGNAIPPGTHAYVGIQIVQVSIQRKTLVKDKASAVLLILHHNDKTTTLENINLGDKCNSLSEQRDLFVCHFGSYLILYIHKHPTSNNGRILFRRIRYSFDGDSFT